MSNVAQLHSVAALCYIYWVTSLSNLLFPQRMKSGMFDKTCFPCHGLHPLASSSSASPWLVPKTCISLCSQSLLQPTILWKSRPHHLVSTIPSHGTMAPPAPCVSPTSALPPFLSLSLEPVSLWHMLYNNVQLEIKRSKVFPKQIQTFFPYLLYMEKKINA